MPLLVASLLFWSFQTGLWLPGVLLTAALLAARLRPRRLHLEQADFARVSDLFAILVVLAYGWLYFTLHNPLAMIRLFQWMPLLLAPLLLAQQYNGAATVDLRALLLSLRRAKHSPGAIDLAPAYFALLLVSASAANTQGPGFLAGTAALLAWACWGSRPPHHSPWGWGLLIGAGLLLGVGVQQGLRQGQQWLEASVSDWLDLEASRSDPYRSSTAIGSIGALKGSSRIIVRVRPPRPLAAALLLHRASYQRYVSGTWLAGNARFASLPEGAGAWTLAGAGVPAGADSYAITEYSEGGDPVLSLPAGAARVAGMTQAALRRNPLGTVQATHRPGYLRYGVEVTATAPLGEPPGPEDLGLPRTESPVLLATLRQLGPGTEEPRHAIALIREYFRRDFRYSLYQAAGTRASLREFLRRDHSGHCEYFASATVLLLRAAGVPARYATGFSLQEYSSLEHQYVARLRHAHAWARAWVDGAWVDVDTTPPNWAALEQEQAPVWGRLYDLGAWAALALDGAGELPGRLAVGLALAWVATRVLWPMFRTQRARTRRAAERSPAARGLGTDSEFYLVLARLAQIGHTRPAWQPLDPWLNTLDPVLPGELPRLREMASLHCAHRFDPQGLDPGARRALERLCRHWLTEHPVPGHRPQALNSRPARP